MFATVFKAFEGRMNNKFLCVFTGVLIQCLIVAICLKYVSISISPLKLINNLNSSWKPLRQVLDEPSGNGFSTGSSFQTTPEFAERISLNYFTTKEAKDIYVWKNAGIERTSQTAAFAAGTAAQQLANTSCTMAKNRTIYNKKAKIRSSCNRWQAIDEVNNYMFKEELDMPIAYSILVYTDFQMLQILLYTIHKPQHLYCIHVDNKSPESFKDRVRNLTKCFDNVFVASKLYDVVWGRFSVLQAEMICMNDLLKRSRSWKYFINLTGQEFPLRTNYEIATLLHKLNGYNLVSCQEKFKNKNMHLEPAGPVPYNLTVYKTPTHVVLTRGFIEYMLKDKTAQEVVQWASKIGIPDEKLFSTLHCNTILKAPGSNRDDASGKAIKLISAGVQRFKLWKGQKKAPCYGRYIRGICVFGPRDLETLKMRHELFLNKLFINFYPQVPYCLMETIIRRTALEYGGYMDFNISHYSTLLFKE